MVLEVAHISSHALKILPPKIYHYEPKIFGFKIAGKRGSKYFNPPKGNVKYIEDSVQALELQDAKQKGGHIEHLASKFDEKLAFHSGDSGAATAVSGQKSAAAPEDNKATEVKSK